MVSVRVILGVVLGYLLGGDIIDCVVGRVGSSEHLKQQIDYLSFVPGM